MKKTIINIRYFYSVITCLMPVLLWGNPQIIISEIFYDSPLNEQIAKGQPYSNGEFIELHNITNKEIDLSNWYLTGDGTTEKYTFPKNTRIPGGGYILLVYQYNMDFQCPYAQEEQPSKQVIYHKKIILKNSGETISLHRSNGGLEDYMHYDGTSNKTKPGRLYAENRDSLNWDHCESLHRVGVSLGLWKQSYHEDSNWERGKITPFQMHLKWSNQNIAFFKGRNYIINRKYIHEHTGDCITEIRFYDGLGYLEQLVEVDKTPDFKDLTTLYKYDAYKNLTHTWLPTLVNNTHGMYASQWDIMKTAQDSYADKYPYLQDDYRLYGTSKKVKHYEAGANLRARNGCQSYSYLVNSNNKELQCYKFEVKNSGVETALSWTGYCYLEGDLDVKRSINEDGAVSYVFTDGMGKVILERYLHKTKNNTTEFYDTYYVYDARNNLSYVLPPELTYRIQDHSLAQDFEDDSELMQQYAYIYKYNIYNCCIAKKLPGISWTFYGYDSMNRIIYFQNEQLRKFNRWFYIFRDFAGRINKIWDVLANNQNITMQDLYDSYINNNMTGPDFDMASWRTEIYKRYGTMSYEDEKEDFVEIPGIVSNRNLSSLPNGLFSYEIIPSYSNDVRQFNYVRHYFYDKNDRIVQQAEINHLGGTNRISTKYSFTGKPLVILEQIQTARNSKIDTKKTIFEYDHADRLVSELTIINDVDSALVLYTYDTYGRLETKQFGPLTERYAYNIRNLETSRENDYFSLSLSYDLPSNSATKPSLSGNITEISWQHLIPNDSIQDFPCHTYAFSYDNLDRLYETKHYKNGLSCNQYLEKTLSMTKMEIYFGLIAMP